MPASHTIFLLILWIVWCALHSALIRPFVTDWIRIKFPRGFRYHRLFYNLFATVSLVPVLFYTVSSRGAPLLTWHGPWQIVPILLGAAALFLFVAGARRYDLAQFLGLRQVREENACSVLTSDCTLDTGGILSVIRHPWYAGGLLVVWARPLDPSALLTNLVICGYLVAGAILEEGKLRVRFGQQYTEYRRHVSMFFPFKWAKRKLLQLGSR
jgi:protein-S-isoprenylcysteine O-methyltransferase Ste14